MIKNFLAKYGRHFWIISLFVTIIATHDFLYDEGDFFSVLMLGGLTYYFFLKGTGRLLEEDDPFVQ